nr:SprT-like domain-containing protein [Oceanococcus sp. HetDA_MAG_MS8]
MDLPSDISLQAIVRAALLRFAQLGYGLECEPTIRWDLRGQAAGQAILQTHTVRLNAELLQSAGEQMTRHTLIHELCHLAVWRRHGRRARPHGPQWQNLMRAMGEEPKRCHDLAASPSRRQRRFRYACACTTVHELSTTRHHRVLRGERYLCRRCGEILRAAQDEATTDR